MWPYRYAYDGPLVTLISNIYGFVDPAPFFLLVNIPYCFFLFLFFKGVWPYRHVNDVPLVTLTLNICVCGSNFNRSSVNHGHKDKQTNRLFTLYSIDE